MKIRNFMGIASAFVAVLALGLVTACQPVEEDDGSDVDIDEDDVSLDSEGGWSDFGDIFGDRRGWGHDSRAFLATLDANQLIPALGEHDPFYRAHGRSVLGLRVRRDHDGRIFDIRPRLRLSLCGLGNQRFIDVSGISVHQGLRGQVNAARTLEALIDEDRPLRMRVINGCAGANLRARFVQGLDIGERFQSMCDHPDNFYYEVRTPLYPQGISRGQLGYYY